MATAIKPVGPTVVAPKGLVTKLCEVMAAVEYVQKRGTNQKHGYKYATEADLVEKIRGELASRKVFIFPSVTTTNRALLYKTASGAEMTITDCMVKWTFVDGESGEQWECVMPGCGTDTQDKGIYKAITGSEKYLLMKSFLIPTGDDPENEPGSKDEQKAVADRKIKEAQARTVAGQPRKPAISILLGDKEGKIFGPGLAELTRLLNAVNPPLKQQEKVWYDDRVNFAWYVEIGAALALQQFCESHGMTCEFVEKATGEVKSSAASVHGSEPRTNRATPEPEVGSRGLSSKRAVLADGRLMGPLDDVNAKNGKKGGFLILQIGEHKAYIFDNKRMDFGKPKGVIPIFDELVRSKHNPVDLLVEESKKDNKVFLNVKGVLRIGPYEWDEESVPVIRRDLPPTNPDITDEDIGI